MNATMNRVPPPGTMRDSTQMTSRATSGKLVIVSTRNTPIGDSWNRVAFLDWLLDQLPLADPPIPHLGRLAELAGMHPSE